MWLVEKRWTAPRVGCLKVTKESLLLAHLLAQGHCHQLLVPFHKLAASCSRSAAALARLRPGGGPARAAGAKPSKPCTANQGQREPGKLQQAPSTLASCARPGRRRQPHPGRRCWHVQRLASARTASLPGPRPSQTRAASRSAATCCQACSMRPSSSALPQASRWRATSSWAPPARPPWRCSTALPGTAKMASFRPARLWSGNTVQGLPGCPVVLVPVGIVSSVGAWCS